MLITLAEGSLGKSRKEKKGKLRRTLSLSSWLEELISVQNMWPVDPVIISSAAQPQTKNNSGSSAVETLCLCTKKALADTKLPLKQQPLEYKR